MADDRALLENIMERSGDAWRVKDRWNELYASATRYSFPERDFFRATPAENQGQDKRAGLYDSTLPNKSQELVSYLISELTPPFKRWARFEPARFIQDDQRADLAESLSVVTDKFFAVLRLSNFDMEIGSFWSDFIIGTAAMMAVPGNLSLGHGPVMFHAAPLSQIAVEEGGFNEVSAVFRKWCLKGRAIRLQWPSDKLDRIETANPKFNSTEYTVHEATMRSEGDDPGPWTYAVAIHGAGVDADKRLIVRERMKRNPWIVGHWSRISGEAYGRGPILNALPDAKTINVAKELLFEAAGNAISGIWTARSGLVADLDREIRGGMIFEIDEDGALQAIPSPGNFNLAQIIFEELQQSIADAMLSNKLPMDAGTPRSPTEWMIRGQAAARQIGAPFGRTVRGVITPMAQLVADIMADMGLIEPIRIGRGAVDLRVTSSLAQAGDMELAQGAVQYLETLRALFPETAPLVGKQGEAMRYLGEKMGVDYPKLVKSASEEQELQAQAQQLAALYIQQMQAQMQTQGSVNGG